MHDDEKRLAAEATGPDLGLGVEHVLVVDLADDAAAAVERPQRLGEIHGTVDFNRAFCRKTVATATIITAAASHPTAPDQCTRRFSG